MSFIYGEIPNKDLTFLDASGIPDVEKELLAKNNLSDVDNSATARDNIELGNMAVQNAANVSISGGSINGVNIGTSEAGFVSSTGVNITGNINIPLTHLADGATINTNCASGNNFIVTLGGNRTLANPTNLSEGVYNWIIKQDATGSRTLAFGNCFQFIPSGAPTLSTTANAIDVISGIYDNSSNQVVCSYVLYGE